MLGKDENTKEPAVSKLFNAEGKPLRVLSTSLGIALLANALFVPGGAGASGSSGEEPKLVSWSTEEVKAYFDKNVDWNIPYPEENVEETVQEGSGVVTSGGTTVINNYGGYSSGFGWDDMLLYHMLFNSGSFYSPEAGTMTGRPITEEPGLPTSRRPTAAAASRTKGSRICGKTENLYFLHRLHHEKRDILEERRHWGHIQRFRLRQ